MTPDERARARERNKRYYQKHRERLLAEHKARNATPEKIAYRKERYSSNREEILSKQRDYHAANKAKRNASHYKAIRNDPDAWAKDLAARRYRKTGISDEQAEELLFIQDNSCAICSRPFSDDLPPRRDHCHDSKDPRGLLCHNCNTIEGMIKKMGLTPSDFSARLAAYLESPPFRLLGE